MCCPAYGNYVVLESATPICRNRYCFTKIGTEARSLTARTRPSQSCSASERSQAVSDREAGEQPRGGTEMKRRTSDRAPLCLACPGYRSRGIDDQVRPNSITSLPAFTASLVSPLLLSRPESARVPGCDATAPVILTLGAPARP